MYDEVARVLIAKYGEVNVDPGGRVTKQARSLKVAFTDPDEPDSDLSFSIDAVPAVHFGDHWGIPSHDTDHWQDHDPNTRWVLTSPIAFNDATESLSVDKESPAVDDTNAYRPIVRLLRQIRHVHLGENRPGCLYTEVAAYYAWNDGRIRGDTWAQLLTATLSDVAVTFQRAAFAGLIDPVLGTSMKPALTPEQWMFGAQIFTSLNTKAVLALESERCQAAKAWREILGENDRGQVLPLPDGCDANGFPLTRISPVTSLGSNQPRGFA